MRLLLVSLFIMASSFASVSSLEKTLVCEEIQAQLSNPDYLGQNDFYGQCVTPGVTAESFDLAGCEQESFFEGLTYEGRSRTIETCGCSFTFVEVDGEVQAQIGNCG